MTRADALVLDLDTRAGLCIARSLGRAGCRVHVAARDASASGMRTRYAARRAVLADPERDFEAYADALVAELSTNPADTVIPSIDESVHAIHRRRAELGRLCAPALGEPEAVEIALSKSRTLEVARALGIAVPRSHPAASRDEVVAAAEELGFPCVLKPVTSWRELGPGGERVGPAYLGDAAAARREGERLERAGAQALVQELAPGPRETHKLFRADGRMAARLSMLVDRTWPPLGGSSVMRCTVGPEPDSLAQAERLVAEIGLEGYAEVEFRRDGRGRPLLMEVNARLSQSVELATRAGVDFPRMQLEWARGGKLPPVSRYAVGLRVGWLAGDARLLAAGLLKQLPPTPPASASARAIARDYILRRARIEGLDLRDPAPVLGAVGFALRALRRPSESA